MRPAEILRLAALLSLLATCAKDPFLPTPGTTSLRSSYVAERLYLNGGYDFAKRLVTSIAPVRQPADFSVWYDALATGNKYRIGTPLETRIFRMNLPAGTALADVGYAETWSTNTFRESWDAESDAFYTIYTGSKCYAILHVIEFQNTGTGATTYIRFEWKLQLDGGTTL